MALRTKWQFMDRSVTHKIARQKNEYGQNPEENIILIGPGQYYTFIACWWGKYEYILIFPEPSCYECFIILNETKKTKSYSTPSEAFRVFPPELSFFNRKTSEALGTHHLQATARMWFLNVWDNVPMNLKYVWSEVPLTICYIILNTCKSVRRHVFCYCISKTKKRIRTKSGRKHYTYRARSAMNYLLNG
jgi:hypothetical protein